MKKVQSILLAIAFLVATTGLCYAQAAPAAPQAQENAAAPADKAALKSRAVDKSYQKKSLKKPGKKKLGKKGSTKKSAKKVSKKQHKSKSF